MSGTTSSSSSTRTGAAGVYFQNGIVRGMIIGEGQKERASEKRWRIITVDDQKVKSRSMLTWNDVSAMQGEPA